MAHPDTNTCRPRDLSRHSPITPPPDWEATIARARELENQARQTLLDVGCPPCYPPELGLPLRDCSQEYEVVSYWQSLPGTGKLVLQAQLADWRASCDYQRRNRQYYVLRDTFSTFVDRVRHRRRKHGLEEETYLLADVNRQSHLANWIEFQNYHLELHERNEIKVKNDKAKLSAALGCSGGVTSEAMDMLEGRLRYGEHKLQEHGKLLR